MYMPLFVCYFCEYCKTWFNETWVLLLVLAKYEWLDEKA